MKPLDTIRKNPQSKIVAEAVLLALGAAYIGSAIINESWLPDWYTLAGIFLGSCFVIWLSYALGPVEKAPAEVRKPAEATDIMRAQRLFSRIPFYAVCGLLTLLFTAAGILLYEFFSRNPF